MFCLRAADYLPTPGQATPRNIVLWAFKHGEPFRNCRLLTAVGFLGLCGLQSMFTNIMPNFTRPVLSNAENILPGYDAQRYSSKGFNIAAAAASLHASYLVVGVCLSCCNSIRLRDIHRASLLLQSCFHFKSSAVFGFPWSSWYFSAPFAAISSIFPSGASPMRQTTWNEMTL